MSEARREGRLDQRQGDGRPLREHLAAALEAGGEIPEELRGSALEPEAASVWGIYREVARGRASGGLGPSPLSWQDLRAWAYLAGETLSAFEMETLIVLDRVYLGAATAERKGGK